MESFLKKDDIVSWFEKILNGLQFQKCNKKFSFMNGCWNLLTSFFVKKGNIL